MTSETRQIIVEGNGPRITYVGKWTTVETSSINEIDPLRFISVPTLQSTKTNSSFSFSFEGSSISVSGTVNSTSNTEMNSSPSWKCSIDGNAFGMSILDLGLNDWSFCLPSGISLADGPHELVVNITSNGVTPFYIEYLVYSPSPNVSLENSLIEINPSDPAIDYISGWDTSGLGNQAETTDPDGLMNVTFIGTQLSWYGGGVQDRNAIASSGEYSIDGKPFTLFQIPTADEELGEFQLFFITPSLEMGPHVLSIRYTGLEGQLPLVLQYLIVMNGSIPSTSTPPMIPSGDGNNAETSHVEANVGEIVGPIVGFGIAIAIFFIYLRYRRRQGHPSPDVVPSGTQDHHPNLTETSEILKDRSTRLLAPPPNVNSSDIVSVDNPDSVKKNPFHIPIHTPFSNKPFRAFE